jgi:hypothetical protein
MTSSEVRWFYSGTVPDKVVAWFKNVAKSAVDHKPLHEDYLVMSDDESYGIKPRDFDEIGSQESKNDIQSKEVELKRRRKYFEKAFIVLILTAFILFQFPQALAQPSNEDRNTTILPPVIGCRMDPDRNPLDPTEMNSIVIPFRIPFVKTIHVDKEVFLCETEGLPVIVDVSIYTEIIEDASRQEPSQKNFEVITCMKYLNGTALGCASQVPPTDLPSLPCQVPRLEFLRFPIEMNSVVVANGTIVKTIMAETEVFSCPDLYSTFKHVTLFTEKFELIDFAPPGLTIDKRNHFETATCIKSEFNATVLGCSFQAIVR